MMHHLLTHYSSFIMSIESKTTHTGPLPATLSPMTVDLIGPKGPFGKLNLPEVKTNSKGADVIIKDQKIQITDFAAFLAFNKSLQLDEKLTMYLDNGHGTIKALGMKSKIVYKKPVAMKGMDGPQTEIVKTEILGDGQFKNTMKIHNPSPVETDLGNVVFAFKNQAGETLATQTGNIFIKKGETIYEATGEVKSKGELGRINIVGIEESKGTWVSKTLEYFNVPVSLTPEMEKLLSA
jgi:hypothetical protein